MKKQLVIAVGLAVLSSSAYATKARLIALGENQDGSYYIGDNRNMFLNPAHINMHKDFVTMEWGSSASTVAESDTAPRAEGGFTKSMGNFVYGVHLGGEDMSNWTHRDDADAFTGGQVFLQQDNTLNLFFGGDAGVQWGANLAYSSSEDEQTTAWKQEQDFMMARLGAVAGNIEGFAHLTFKDEAKGSTTGGSDGDKYDADFSWRIGGSYLLNDLKIYGTYYMNENEITNAAGAGGTAAKAADAEYKGYEIGVGRTTDLNDKAKFFTRVAYTFDSTEFKTTTDAAASADKTLKKEVTAVPVVIGLEAEANSWLVLRGSISQKLFASQEGDATTDTLNSKKKSLADTTNVNVGSTLKFGNLNVDGLVGTDNGSGTAANTASETGTLRLDNLMTRVAVRYNF